MVVMTFYLLIYQPLVFQRWKKHNQASKQSPRDVLQHVLYEAKNIGGQSSTFTRMAVLEARAAKRASVKILAFLPLMFLIFGFVLGESVIFIHTTNEAKVDVCWI